MKKDALTGYFKTLKVWLKSELKVKNAMVSIASGAKPQDVKTLNAFFNDDVPQGLDKYYQNANGHYLIWSKEFNGYRVGGYSIFFSIADAAAGTVTTYHEGKLKSGLAFYPDTLSSEQKRQLSRHWLLEQLAFGTFVLIEPENHHLVHYTPPFTLRKIKLTFAEYLDKLLDNRGLYNWQAQFIEETYTLKHKLYQNDSDVVERQSAENLSLLDNNYQHRLTTLVSQLKGCPAIKNIKLEQHARARPEEVKRAERSLGHKLPGELVKFYSELNGFKLSWQGDGFKGLLDIPDLATVFGGPKNDDTLYWDYYATYELLWNEEIKVERPNYFEQIKHKRVFDRHLRRNQLIMEVDGADTQFFFWNDFGMTPMRGDVEKVLDLIFQTGGVEYYPQLLIETRDKQVEDLIVERVHLFNPEFNLKNELR